MRFKYFVRNLLLPKTGIYILLGIIIMFFTFFTNDNALEIAISGIASIFIGIGVNNFTQMETHEKDMEGQSRKIDQAIRILLHTKTKISNTRALFDENISAAAAKQQLAEISDFLELSINQLKDM